jgi:uncharacterized protein YigE (DUF2233 family)
LRAFRRQRILGLAAAVCVLAALFAAAAAQRGRQENACAPHAFEGLRFTVCVFDLRSHLLRLFWKDEDGVPYAAFQRLPPKMNGGRLVFAMNAGIYRPDLSPAGLYVENGETLREANTANGPGNFHMKPNGVFFVAGDEAGVVTTERYLAEPPKADYATQSGPMLVIDGRLHPRFHRDSTSRKRRDGVGERDAHTVVFAIAEEPVNFHQFARLFRDDLGCDDALFLDGTISSLYAPALGRSDSLRPMGPIIAVFTKP